MSAGETVVLDMSQTLRLDMTNRKYCGPVYLHAVIDKDNDIAEPREDQHHLVTHTTVICDGGTHLFSGVMNLTEELGNI